MQYTLKKNMSPWATLSSGCSFFSDECECAPKTTDDVFSRTHFVSVKMKISSCHCVIALCACMCLKCCGEVSYLFFFSFACVCET